MQRKNYGRENEERNCGPLISITKWYDNKNEDEDEEKYGKHALLLSYSIHLYTSTSSRAQNESYNS